MRVYAFPTYGRPTAVHQQYEAVRQYAGRGARFDAVLFASSGPGYEGFPTGKCGYIGSAPIYHAHSDERWGAGEARNVLTSMFEALAGADLDAATMVQTDDDCVLSKIDMGPFLKAFEAEHPRVGLAMPLLKSGFVCQYARKQFVETGATKVSVHAPLRIVGVSGHVVKAIGHYDPFLVMTQDLDYAIRARAAGFDPTCYDALFGEDTLSEAKFGGHGLYRQTSVDDAVQRERAERMLGFKRYLVQQYPGSSIDRRGNFTWQRALRAADAETRKVWARRLPPLLTADAIRKFLT